MSLHLKTLPNVHAMSKSIRHLVSASLQQTRYDSCAPHPITLRNLTVLWKLFEICLLRAGPQDVPGTPRFLQLMLAGYFLVDVLVAQLNFGFRDALGVSALDVLLLVAFTRLLLQGASKLERYNQTLAAMAGTGQLLGVAALPLIHGLNVAEAAGESAPLLVLLWLAVLIWSLLVLGHILRHALSTNLMAGVGVGILYSVLTMIVVRVIFPGGG